MARATSFAFALTASPSRDSAAVRQLLDALQVNGDKTVSISVAADRVDWLRVASWFLDADSR